MIVIIVDDFYNKPRLINISGTSFEEKCNDQQLTMGSQILTKNHIIYMPNWNFEYIIYSDLNDTTGIIHEFEHGCYRTRGLVIIVKKKVSGQYGDCDTNDISQIKLNYSWCCIM